mmetsp:Transcript_90813/g.256481  ORF Transcript_90813/g.256481 Transcript_90813/m.256481 type:complete len:227 (+) Transcript_90813:151-831(+)
MACCPRTRQTSFLALLHLSGCHEPARQPSRARRSHWGEAAALVLQRGVVDRFSILVLDSHLPGHDEVEEAVERMEGACAETRDLGPGHVRDVELGGVGAEVTETVHDFAPPGLDQLSEKKHRPLLFALPIRVRLGLRQKGEGDLDVEFWYPPKRFRCLFLVPHALQLLLVQPVRGVNGALLKPVHLQGSPERHLGHRVSTERPKLAFDAIHALVAAELRYDVYLHL